MGGRKIAEVLLPAVALLWAATSRADSETRLFTADRETCEINATATTEWRTIIFRIADHDHAAHSCIMTPNDTAGLINLAFATLQMQEQEIKNGSFKSIFLGRLIDYQWLSRHLARHAERDVDWSAETGKAKDGERAEAYVMRTLGMRAVLDPLDEALKSYGYLASGFSCEKAMVSGPDTIEFQPAWVAADKRLPFDALCHLVLKPLE